jgi:hypothetical protein
MGNRSDGIDSLNRFGSKRKESIQPKNRNKRIDSPKIDYGIMEYGIYSI